MREWVPRRRLQPYVAAEGAAGAEEEAGGADDGGEATEKDSLLVHMFTEARRIAAEHAQTGTAGESRESIRHVRQLASPSRMTLGDWKKIVKTVAVFGNNRTDSVESELLVRLLYEHFDMDRDAALKMCRKLGLWGAHHGAKYALELLRPLCESLREVCEILVLFAGDEGALMSNATDETPADVDEFRHELTKNLKRAVIFFQTEAESMESDDGGVRGPFRWLVAGQSMECIMGVLCSGGSTGHGTLEYRFSLKFADAFPFVPTAADNTGRFRPEFAHYCSSIETGHGANAFTMVVADKAVEYKIRIVVSVSPHPEAMAFETDREIAASAARMLFDDELRLRVLPENRTIYLDCETMFQNPVPSMRTS